MDFKSLIALQDAAMSCGGYARRFIEQHSTCDWSTDDWCAESNAGHKWNDVERTYTKLGEYANKFEHHPEHDRLLDLIKYANANHLNPVTIAGSSYTTAHEAAVGFAHAVRHAIEGAEGETKRERCEDLAERLQSFKHLSDFYGLIEAEHLRAVDSYEWPDEAGTNDDWPILTPKELRTLFRIGQDALKERLDSQNIPNKKINSKAYKVNPICLPTTWETTVGRAPKAEPRAV